jgi:cytochrome c peroxidase
MSDRLSFSSTMPPGKPRRALEAICLALIAWSQGGPFDISAEEPTSGGRIAARPERSAAARTEAAEQLRDVYRGPPATWPAPHVDEGVAWQEIGTLPPVMHPEQNPFNREKMLLGKLLFFDARLSASGKIACVSCHDPGLAWADGRPVSQPPSRSPGRNTPTIRNVGHRAALFWDGRAATLEQQAEEALCNPLEMAASSDNVVGLLTASPRYLELFAAAFPDRPVSLSGVVEAIACYERSIVGGRSRFDAFFRGDGAALSDAEILGLDLFRRDARCMNCHHGPTFSDDRLHVLGLSFFGKSNEDLGRYDVSTDPADSGRFLTPSLRDVTRTQPLMHSGRFSLSGVLNMYNAGMVRLRRRGALRDDPLVPVTSPHLRPLGLNRQDLADLAAFLAALEEPPDPEQPPQLPADSRIRAAR